MTTPVRLILGGLALGAFVVITWGALKLSSDLEEPEDRDLLLPRSAVADGDNGYTSLEAALRALDGQDEASATGSAASATADTAAVLRHLDDALARPAWVFPASDREDEVSARLMALAEWVDGRALRAAETGEVDAAFAEARRLIRLGERLAVGEGVSLVPAMVGARIQELGYARTRTLIEVHPDSKDGLRAQAERLGAWLEQLGDRPIPVEARRRVWAGEYALFKARFREGLRAESEQVPPWLGSVHEGYFFQENRTLSMIAAGYRELRDAAHTCGEGLDTEAPEMSTLDYVRPNAVGEILARVAAPDFAHYLTQFCALEAHRQATRSIVALRAYRLEHGRDAESLDVLVPTYFRALPQDPFGGGALRYSRDHKRVWSVGRDGLDGGGEVPDTGEAIDEIALPTELVLDVASHP